VSRWGAIVKFDLAPWPNVTAFMERVRNRPNVQDAMKAEGIHK
jgi:glutathione S-transferase